MKAISELKKFNDNELINIWHNALNLIERNKEVELAKQQIEYIELEWEDRLNKFIMGISKSTRPNEGLLKTIGYKVGKDGIPRERRRLILDRILKGKIPFCGSKAYMVEWGAPSTRKRYNKLNTVINRLIIRNRNMPGIEKAILEWSEDLEYLRDKYKDSFPKPYIN